MVSKGLAMEGRRKPKRKRGRHKGGLANFVRQALRSNPRLTTGALRKLAEAEFGYRPTIDRHFPQLVYRIKRERAAKTEGRRVS